jgi:hypothetical protein
MPPKTALRKYERLESPGLWRETPSAQRREVIVGLREATLILSDPKNESPLAQWSLPAITRINPAQMPALYSPGAEAIEVLEIDDKEMIAALDTVHVVIARRKPHPGRLRNLILAVTVAGLAAVVFLWLPGRLVGHTAEVLPDPTRADLGQGALADLVRVSGSPCRTVPGRRAAATLAARLFPDNTPQIEILREGLDHPANLPGNILLLPAKLVQDAKSPEVVAGYLIAESLRAQATDPVLPLLAHLGLGSTIRLLTTGTPGTDAMAGYGEVISTQPAPPPLSPDLLLPAFAKARVPSSPYAYSLDPTGETTLSLIEADPFAHETGERVLSDETWLELQAICTE